MAISGRYYTKELLYLEIENLRDHMGIRACDYPLDMKSICRKGGLEINMYPFATKGLQGMLTVDADGVGYITLNARNSPSEQNFFCGHESIHYLIHRDNGQTLFQCYDKIRKQQDRIIEWQANEGTAEWLVPYKAFIPDFLDNFDPLMPTPDLGPIRAALAEKYFVSERVIYNRIDNLKYEIWQVATGTSLDKVKLLSKHQQTKCGLQIISCNELSDLAGGIGRQA